MTDIGLTSGDAAAYLGLHIRTVQRLDREGKLPSGRTATGRRYFSREVLDNYLGKTSLVKPRASVAYCRVSSQAQKNDLKHQRKVLEEFCVAKGLANVEFIEEVGGGLNFKRPKFLDLIDRIVDGSVERLIIAYNDRLTRFGVDLVVHLCETHNCEFLVLNTETLSPEQEMVQDLMAITHCFSARLYGLRNYRKALEKAVKDDTDAISS